MYWFCEDIIIIIIIIIIIKVKKVTFTLWQAIMKAQRWVEVYSCTLSLTSALGRDYAEPHKYWRNADTPIPRVSIQNHNPSIRVTDDNTVTTDGRWDVNWIDLAQDSIQ
jgi:hypothetical protein